MHVRNNWLRDQRLEMRDRDPESERSSFLSLCMSSEEEVAIESDRSEELCDYMSPVLRAKKCSYIQEENRCGAVSVRRMIKHNVLLHLAETKVGENVVRGNQQKRFEKSLC